MADERTIYYTDPREITRYYKPGNYQDPYALASDSGASQTNEERVYIAAASLKNVVPGDWLRVYDTADPLGEEVQVQSISISGGYAELTEDLTGDYEATAGGYAELQSYFTGLSTYADAGAREITSSELIRMINDVEAEIERRTGHAWRAATASGEVHDYPMDLRDFRDWKDGIPIKLNHRSVRTFDSTSGDHIYINENTGYSDKISTWTEALNGDFWVDYTNGIFYLKKFYRWHSRGALKFTYRYGETSVPSDIRAAATLMVVVRLLEMEYSLSTHPDGTDLAYNPMGSTIANYKVTIERILRDNEEVRGVWP